MNKYKRKMDFQPVQVLRCGCNCDILLTFLLYSEFSFFTLFLRYQSVFAKVNEQAFMGQISEVVLTDRSLLLLGF